MKVCSLCGIEKSLDEFYKKSNGDLRSDCKECCNKRAKKYREENHEKILKYRREKLYSDPEWMKNNRLRGKKYYDNNTDKILEYKKDYVLRIAPCVYVVKNTQTDEVLYVGESRRPRDRWNRHLTISDGHFISPVSKLITDGELNKDHVEISVLEEVENDKERREREKYWIEKLSPTLNIHGKNK